MTWVVENSNIIMIVLLTVVIGLLVVVIGHLRTLIEETAYFTKLYENSSPTNAAEDIRDISEVIARIELSVDNINRNTSD